jgi:hypothetical protein
MAGKVLMKTRTRGGLLGSGRQELIVSDDSVEMQTTDRGQSVTTTFRYEKLNEVRITRRLLTVDLEFIGQNGAGDIVVRGLPKAEAEKAKVLIDGRMRSTPSTTVVRPRVDGRLASLQLDSERTSEELKARIAIVESEFQASRRELLAKVDNLSHDLREFKLLMAATTIYVSAQDHGSGIRGCVDAAEELLEEIQRRETSRNSIPRLKP